MVASGVEGATPAVLWAKLIDRLQADGVIRTERIRNAFLTCGRYLMVDEKHTGARMDLAESDNAFNIGYGQTISQPRMVATMTELLQPVPGETALDVGLGSGWQAAILSELVGPEGKVIAIERIRGLIERTTERLDAIGAKNVTIIHGDALNPEDVPLGPYDMITCAAASVKAPDFWTERLSTTGRLVYPKQIGIVKDGKLSEGKDQLDFGKGVPDGPMQRLCVTRKTANGLTEEFHGEYCRYVPLVEGTT